LPCKCTHCNSGRQLLLKFSAIIELAVLVRALKSWDLPSINVGLANGAEVDLKIEEDFKEEDLVTFLKSYAEGKEIGGNILTSELIVFNHHDCILVENNFQPRFLRLVNKRGDLSLAIIH